MKISRSKRGTICTAIYPDLYPFAAWLHLSQLCFSLAKEKRRTCKFLRKEFESMCDDLEPWSVSSAANILFAISVVNYLRGVLVSSLLISYILYYSAIIRRIESSSEIIKFLLQISTFSPSLAGAVCRLTCNYSRRSDTISMFCPTCARDEGTIKEHRIKLRSCKSVLLRHHRRYVLEQSRAFSTLASLYATVKENRKVYR